MENDIVVHEMTHGITNRMTGGGTGRCLQTLEAGGLGEGWSDAMAEYAFSFALLFSSIAESRHSGGSVRSPRTSGTSRLARTSRIRRKESAPIRTLPTRTSFSPLRFYFVLTPCLFFQERQSVEVFQPRQHQRSSPYAHSHLFHTSLTQTIPNRNRRSVGEHVAQRLRIPCCDARVF